MVTKKTPEITAKLTELSKLVDFFKKIETDLEDEIDNQEEGEEDLELQDKFDMLETANQSLDSAADEIIDSFED